MEYGHSWTNLRDKERNLFFVFFRRRDRGDLKWEYNGREKDLQMYGVYSVCHIRTNWAQLCANEAAIALLHGPIRHKHVPWTKLAKSLKGHTKNFDKRRQNWSGQWVLQATTQPNLIPIFCLLSCAKFDTIW